MIADLPICPENYSISSEGFVISKRTGRAIKSFKNPSGYLVSTVSYHGKRLSFSVHRQVMLAFCPIPDHAKFDVNHLDGDKTNNNFENLDWCTKSDNTKHMLTVLGKQRPATYKRVRLFSYDFSKEFYNVNDIANYLNVHVQSVYRALSKRRNTIKGFNIEYI